MDKIFTFETPDDDQRRASRVVFGFARRFADVLNNLPESREKSLAMTSLQHTVLWADAAIAIHGRPPAVSKTSKTHGT